MQTLVAERTEVHEVVRVLIIDHEIDAIRDSRDELQRSEGFLVHGARSIEDARALLTSGAFDVVLVSPELWAVAGPHLLASVRKQRRDTAFVILGDVAEMQRRGEPTPVVRVIERRRAVEPGYLADALRSAHAEQRSRRRRETMARWLEREASTDRLTGLLSNRAFAERLNQACARARRHKKHVSVIVADVTGTRMVNRAHGELAGDDMLRRAAAGIARCIRGNDSAGRIGGDEFGILLEDADLEVARRVARRIAHEIDRLNAGEWDGDIPVTLSFGVATGYGCTPEQLIDAARVQLAPHTIVRPAYLPAWSWRNDDGPSVA